MGRKRKREGRATVPMVWSSPTRYLYSQVANRLTGESAEERTRDGRFLGDRVIRKRRTGKSESVKKIEAPPQLLRLGVNLKNFPSPLVNALYAALFHLGIAGVLLLYVLFWLKLDLFTTLKALGLLGAFLMFVGHRSLSYLASTSAKLKSA